MFLLLFTCCVDSTLKRGDNPYSILGVSRDASDADIRAAYRKLVIKYHPDHSKEKDTEKTMIRINDAYEILSDKRKKLIYDQTGSVDENAFERDEREQQGYYSFQNDFFFRKFFMEKDFEFEVTEEINALNVKEVLKKEKKMFVLVHNGRNFEYSKMFEEVASEFGDNAKFMWNNVRNGGAFANMFGVRSVPSLLFLSLDKNKEIKVKKLSSIKSKKSYVDSIFKMLNANYKKFTSIKKLNDWLNKNIHYTRVINIGREIEPNFDFLIHSTKFQFCKFAYFSNNLIDAIRTYNLTELPTVIIFKGNSNKKATLPDDLEKLSNPLFIRLTVNNIENLCKKFCLLYIGKPTKEIFNNFTTFNDAPIVYISEKSRFAKKLKIDKNNKWVIFSSKTNKYSSINIESKYSDISKFLSNKLKTKKFETTVDKSPIDYFEIAKNKVTDILSSIPNLIELFTDIDDVPLLSFLFCLVLFLIKMFSH